MKTKIAMQKRDIRYFSSLTTEQKQKTANTLKIALNGLLDLPYGLALQIISQDLDKLIEQTDFVNEKLKGAKVKKFYPNGKFKGIYFPLNINSILTDYIKEKD